MESFYLFLPVCVGSLNTAECRLLFPSDCVLYLTGMCHSSDLFYSLEGKYCLKLNISGFVKKLINHPPVSVLLNKCKVVGCLKLFSLLNRSIVRAPTISMSILQAFSSYVWSQCICWSMQCVSLSQCPSLCLECVYMNDYLK